jgi:hypothetical protein
MSTIPQPPNVQLLDAQQGGFQPVQPMHLGGALVMPAPLPSVKSYPLSPTDFLALRDGEMSEARSLRDTCFGAFLVGLAAIASQLSTLEWDSAMKQGRHPIFWTVLIFAITGTTFAIGVVTHLLTRHMRTRSAYSRQIGTICKYFDIKDTERGVLSWLSGIFTRPSN